MEVTLYYLAVRIPGGETNSATYSPGLKVSDFHENGRHVGYMPPPIAQMIEIGHPGCYGIDGRKSWSFPLR